MVILLLTMGIITPVMAQLPVIAMKPGFKPNLEPVKGGADGKNYAVIIHTGLSQKELVGKTTEVLLRWQLVKREDIRLDEITDEQSEYTIPFTFRQSFAGVPYMMGARVVFPPVVISGNLRFEFHGNGNVMIVWDQLKELSFCTVDGERFRYYDPVEHPDMAEYQGHYGAALMENTLLLKAMIIVGKGIDGLMEYNRKLDAYFADIDSKYAVFAKVAAAGKGRWLTDTDMIRYGSNTGLNKGEKGMLEFMKQYYDEGRLLSVCPKRWEDHIRPVVAKLFKLINISLDGSIKGVSEDGEKTYVEIKGLVLPVDPKWADSTPPVDPKALEKYIKKNEDKQY